MILYMDSFLYMDSIYRNRIHSMNFQLSFTIFSGNYNSVPNMMDLGSQSIQVGNSTGEVIPVIDNE